MKKSIYTKLLIVCSMFCLLTSCSKEDISTEQIQSDVNHAEMYLNSHDVPAIMFSYNVLNTDTKVLNSILIDDEGQLRTNTTQAFEIRQVTLSSGATLQALKDESKIVEDQSVTLEELVQNFSLLRNATRIEYDSSVEKEGPQMLTAVYGYYYDYAEARSTTTNDCGGTSTRGGSGSTGSFRALLLEQKLAGDIIQKNPTAKWTADWVNGLVSSSPMDLAGN